MTIRVLSEILELDIDRCSNTYGVAPCTASGSAGSECYNTFNTCQDKPNFVRGTHTIKFTKRGSPIPAGGLVRPYIERIDRAPTEIDIEEGYAPRNATALTLADETDPDVDEDPYLANRATAPQGTFWTRLLARSPNYVNRDARMSRVIIEDGVWGTARVEKYIIDRISGPDLSGGVRITLKDPTKRVDRTKIPAPTDGKLLADLAATAHTGLCQSGSTTTTVKLANDASAVDDAYNGMEWYPYAGTGSGNGQRRVITDYVGATRVATLASSIAVVPDTTTAYEVGALSITLDAGKGSQYRDPATTGKREFVRIGAEIIEYTAISTDTLSWPSSTYRAAFGSTREDHSADDVVQGCRSWISELFTDVVRDIHTDSGIAVGDIDTAGFATQDATWLGDAYRVTACISDPEDADDLLTELLPLANAVVWWDPVDQAVKLQVLLPGGAAIASWTDAANLIDRSVKLERLDDLRRTRFAVWFGIKDATENEEEARQYTYGEIAIDADAESENEYGDVRPEAVYSRWFDSANVTALRAWVKRRLNQYRNTPLRLTVEVDPKDAGVQLGEQLTLTSAYLTDETGAPKATRMLVTRVEEKGTRIGVRLRAMPFNRRYAFIAPNGTADHPTDTAYAHISNNSNVMGDGSDPYVII